MRQINNGSIWLNEILRAKSEYILKNTIFY